MEEKENNDSPPTTPAGTELPIVSNAEEDSLILLSASTGKTKEVEESEIIVPEKPAHSDSSEFQVEAKNMEVDPDKGYIDRTSKEDLEKINQRAKTMTRGELNSIMGVNFEKKASSNGKIKRK